jgi:hypothetical protein
MKRFVTVIVVVVLGATMLATYAAAGPPTKVSFEGTFTDTVTGICSFPLDVRNPSGEPKPTSSTKAVSS